MRHKLYINDSIFKHGLYTSNPLPIVRHSKYMEWDFNPPEDNDIQIVYTDLSFDLVRKNSKNNIGWIFESPEYHKKYYKWIKNNFNNFKHIITHNKELLSVNNKFKFAPHAGAWIHDEDFKVYDKFKDFSLIASFKNQTSGHNLRHQIARAGSSKIDLYGNGYNKIEKKVTALKDYRYTFCIENCKVDYYFTEKLIDCFLTGVIPIYWGCPSIGDFFNLKGMIVFDDLNDLKNKLKNCTKEYYENNLEYVYDNFEKAKKYLLAEDYIYENDRTLLYE
jgi:hypothetical protein